MNAPSAPAAPAERPARLVAERGLGWLRRHCELGALPPGSSAEISDPDSLYKPLGETALAASVVLREGGAREETAARELLDFAWWELRQGDLLYERQLRYPMLTDPLELYTHFVRVGYRHERLDALLQHLGGLTSVRAAEMLPNRRLALANAARLTGLERGIDWQELTDATWLGRTPEAWAIDWMTAYCMTHTVFHLTDWGAHPAGLPDPLQRYLGTWLPVWQEVWHEIEEWDLLAELLLVDACLSEPLLDARLWESLASVQREDGLMPRDGSTATDADGDPSRQFTDHHHTTVVSTVAATLACARAGGTLP